MENPGDYGRQWPVTLADELSGDRTGCGHRPPISHYTIHMAIIILKET